MAILSDDGLIAANGFSITNSVRCRSAGSTYLSRTPSVSGNRQKFTISAWVKRSAIAGIQQGIISARVDDNNRSTVYWTGGETFNIANVIGGTVNTGLGTAAVFRDVGAWYHLQVAVDTTDATSTNRVKMYMNGLQVSISGTYPTLNEIFTFNFSAQHTWGMNNKATPDYSDQYMSDCYLIDGAALTPTSFGKFDTNGVWVPIRYSGASLPVYNQYTPTGSTFGNMTGNGGLAAAFNGVVSSASAACAYINPGPGYVGKAFSSAQPITRVIVTSSTGAGYNGWTNDAGATVTISVYGKSSLPSTPTDGTLIATTTQSGTTVGLMVADLQFTAASYQYVWVYINNSGSSLSIAEVQYFTTASSNSYGTNGCHLEFKNASALGTDTSGITTSYNQYTPTGSTFGDMTDLGGLSFAFDGTTSATHSNSAAKNAVTSCYVGKAFASAQTISQVVIYGPNNYSWDTYNTGPITLEIYGKSSLPANATDGTLISSQTISATTANQVATFQFSPVSYQYIWARMSKGTAMQYGCIVEMQYFVTGANNFTSSGFTSSDQMIDTPTNNYATLNPTETIVNSSSLSDGNLTQPGYGGTGGSSYNAIATMGVSSGKWYWECKLTTRTQTGSLAGICGPGVSGNLSRDFYGYYEANGNKYSCAAGAGSFTTAAFGSAWNTGVVLGIAFDADAGTLAYYLAGTLVGTAFTGISSTSHSWFPCSTGSGGQDGMTFNFGQSSFAYTPPTGFKSLCTNNLPSVAITKPGNYFQPLTYTGDGNSTKTLTTNFQPDLVWSKQRDLAWSHQLWDSIRGFGTTLGLHSNTTDAESSSDANATYGYVSGVGTNSVSLVAGSNVGTNSYTNKAGGTYIEWLWKKGSTPGFDIVGWTGTGAGQVVNHSLGTTPKMIIVRRRDAASDWAVWFSGVTANTEYLYLDSAAAKTSFGSTWITPSSSSITYNAAWNITNAGTHIAYLWAEVPGFSKFGSYTGNGNADGPFVYCGFKPRYIMVKRSDTGGNDWFIYDSARDTYNVMGSDIYGNLSNAEATGNARFDFTSNGFKLRNTSVVVNASGSTYIYAAFAENPFGGSNVSPATAR